MRRECGHNVKTKIKTGGAGRAKAGTFEAMEFPFVVKVPSEHIRRVVREALREDLAEGDVTTALSVDRAARASAVFKLKDDGVIVGFDVVKAVFAALDPRARVGFEVDEGMWCAKGTTVARVRGRARSILSGERVALNFMQRLSGVATMTRRFVEQVSGTGVKILDTRKTTPNLRLLEKQAVALGGGYSHRPSLASLALIKDNHIRAAGSIREAVELVRAAGPRVLVEVEVAPDADLAELAAVDADILMFDNWPAERLRPAIRRARYFARRPLIEVSGRIRLDNVRRIALCGPDFISVGYITHSAPALDISLDLES